MTSHLGFIPLSIFIFPSLRLHNEKDQHDGHHHGDKVVPEVSRVGLRQNTQFIIQSGYGGERSKIMFWD